MYVPTISFFNATPTTEIYTLSLHDALPISERRKKHVPTLVRLVKLLVELRIDRAETSLGLLQIDTGIQTCDRDRKSTRLNSSHANISYAVFCLKKKKKKQET